MPAVVPKEDHLHCRRILLRVPSMLAVPLFEPSLRKIACPLQIYARARKESHRLVIFRVVLFKNS
jgi:hypothetical protein